MCIRDRYNSAQLKKAVANLTKELEAKQQQIETLQAELASKNIRDVYKRQAYRHCSL